MNVGCGLLLIVLLERLGWTQEGICDGVLWCHEIAPTYCIIHNI